MGGSSKFSLPLSGRKARSQKVDGAVVDVPPPMTSHSTLSKAERLLGAAGLPGQSPQLRPQTSMPLLERPSYASLAVSEISVANISESDKRSNSTVRRVSNSRPHPLRSQAPNDFAVAPDEDSGRAESIHSRSTWQLKSQESSSTLKSYYDPKKSPMAVSRQTSDSVVRDMSPRQGKPPVIRTIPNAYANAPVPRTMGENGAEDIAPTVPLSRKRKPARLDFSRMFQKPKPVAVQPTPTDHEFTMTKPIVHIAPSLRSKASISSMAQSHKFGRRALDPYRSDAKDRDQPVADKPRAPPVRDEVGIFKSTVRRPPRGMKHWADGLLEEEDDDDLEYEVNDLPAPPAADRHCRTESKAESCEIRIETNSGIGQQPPQSSPFLPDAPDWAALNVHPRSPISLSSRNTSRSKSSKMANSNLQDVSIISSSTDDDSEDDNYMSNGRDSFPISDLGDTILIGKAHAFEVKSRTTASVSPAVERRASVASSTLSSHTTSSKMSSSSTYLAVPRPRNAARPESIPEASDESSKPSSLASSETKPHSARAFQSEGHKLMAVTAEEEALLEMMRRKRAAMAKHSYAEGYKAGSQQEVRSSSAPTKTRYATSQPSASQSLAQRRAKIPPSLINSFPISHSQRSSLILAAAIPSPPPMAALPDPPVEPPSKRLSRLSMNTAVSVHSTTSVTRRRHSQLSSVSTVSTEQHPDKSAPPNLATATKLSPLDVSTSVVNKPVKHHHSPTPSSESQVSPLPSPMTPQLTGGSDNVTVLIKSSSSARDSTSSSAALDATERSLLDEAHIHAAIEKKGHRRGGYGWNSSGSAHILPPPEPESVEEMQRPLTAPEHAQEIAKKKATLHINTSLSHHEKCADRSMCRHSAFGLVPRCSVSDDVLAAWTDLGGWADLDFRTAHVA